MSLTFYLLSMNTVNDYLHFFDKLKSMLPPLLVTRKVTVDYEQTIYSALRLALLLTAIKEHRFHLGQA